MRTTRNRVYRKLYRGFESPYLRHKFTRLSRRVILWQIRGRFEPSETTVAMVRQQVDFASKTQQNRHGCRAGIYAERIPPISAILVVSVKTTGHAICFLL